MDSSVLVGESPRSSLSLVVLVLFVVVNKEKGSSQVNPPHFERVNQTTDVYLIWVSV